MAQTETKAVEDDASDADTGDSFLDWTGLPWWAGFPIAAVLFAALDLIARVGVPDSLPPQHVRTALWISQIADAARLFIPGLICLWAIIAGLARQAHSRRKDWAALLGRDPVPRSSPRKDVVSAGTGSAASTPACPKAQSAGPAARKKPDVWSMDLLREIEWKRFEELCAEYFRCCGFHATTRPFGPDGGKDIVLRSPERSMRVVSIVQCKQRHESGRIGPKVIRELLGVMTDGKVNRGVVVTSTEFTRDAREFAAGNPIHLINGVGLLKGILSRPVADQNKLLSVATEGEYWIPTCVRCGSKTERRRAIHGPEYWTCTNKRQRCNFKIWIPRGREKGSPG